MKKLLFLLILLVLVTTGYSQVTVTTNMRLTGNDNQGRAVVQIDSLIHIGYDSGITAGRNSGLSSSTGAGYGSSGTWSKQSTFFPNYLNECHEAVVINDTSYWTIGQNGYPPMIRKIYGPSATLGTLDTCLAINCHYGYNMAMNYWGDTVIFFMDSSSAILYARYTDSRYTNSSTWQNTSGSAISITSSGGKRCAFWHGLLYHDVSSTSAGDAYFLGVQTTKVVGSNLWVTDGNDYKNMTMTPQSPNSDTIYFAFERGDTVWFASYYLRTSDTTLVQLQLTYLTDGAGVPSANNATNRRAPNVVCAGDSVVVLYRHMSDTLNTDSVDIRYRISGDRGATWQAERVLLAATNGNGVFCLSAPYFYDWTCYQHLVFAVYTDANGDATTHTLSFVSDTVGTNTAPPASTLKKRRRREALLIPDSLTTQKYTLVEDVRYHEEVVIRSDHLGW